MVTAVTLASGRIRRVSPGIWGPTPAPTTSVTTSVPSGTRRHSTLGARHLISLAHAWPVARLRLIPVRPSCAGAGHR